MTCPLFVSVQLCGRGNHEDIVLLYRGKGLHHLALELLSSSLERELRVSSHSPAVSAALDALVDYLRGLGQCCEGLAAVLCLISAAVLIAAAVISVVVVLSSSRRRYFSGVVVVVVVVGGWVIGPLTHVFWTCACACRQVATPRS
jgi:hypothetical protein